MNSRLLVGIDPGVDTGLAIYDPATKTLLAVETVPIHRALDRVRRLRSEGPIHVFVEDARQRHWFEKERSNSDYRGKLMGAGAAKRDAKIWEDFLTDETIAFTMVAPRKGATKWDVNYFQAVTGWRKRTSEHARDAAVLVFGRAAASALRPETP